MQYSEEVELLIEEMCRVLAFLECSDVPAPAWPESPGFGLALGGLGLRKS